MFKKYFVKFCSRQMELFCQFDNAEGKRGKIFFLFSKIVGALDMFLYPVSWGRAAQLESPFKNDRPLLGGISLQKVVSNVPWFLSFLPFSLVELKAKHQRNLLCWKKFCFFDWAFATVKLPLDGRLRLSGDVR